MQGGALGLAAQHLSVPYALVGLKPCSRAQGRRRQYCQPGQPGKVSLEMYEALTSLQQERAEDPFGWVVPVCEG